MDVHGTKLARTQAIDLVDSVMRLVPIDRTASGLPLDITAGDSVAAETVRATLALYDRRGYEPPWIGYLGLEGDCYVGACGFAAPPAGGELEIAYFTFPGSEGKGVASRMAAELLRITRHATNGARYIAHTLPSEGPSTRILRRLGFELMGPIDHPEDGTVWKWREIAHDEA